jgi:hypothetical protein
MLEASMAFIQDAYTNFTREGIVGDRFSRVSRSQSIAVRCGDGALLALQLSTREKFWTELTQALEAEWRGRHQRGVESRLKLARLPWVKTLDQFDFEFQPSIDRRQVRELAGLSFVERAENVVLLGPPDPAT